MGMFDVLKISPTLLPVNDEVRKGIEIEKVEWQTKDLDNCISNLEITHSGRLIETILEETVDLDYHGIFEFHSPVGKQWFSFLAKFTDGNLVCIVRVEDEIKYGWPPTPFNSFFKNEKTNTK